MSALDKPKLLVASALDIPWERTETQARCVAIWAATIIINLEDRIKTLEAQIEQ